ncbi:hypothetical protein K1Y78_63150, partial [Streptomyces sp. tea 10]|nr:hypothetical protein [Streptomyces sp. tea 10]
MSEFPRSTPDQQPPRDEQAVPASVRGAVDLGASGGARTGAPSDDAAAASAGAGSYRVELTTATFQRYAEASATYPVVVVLHA